MRMERALGEFGDFPYRVDQKLPGCVTGDVQAKENPGKKSEDAVPGCCCNHHVAVGRKPHGPEPMPSHRLRLPFDQQRSGSGFLTVSVLFYHCSPRGWFVCLPPTEGNLVPLRLRPHQSPELPPPPPAGSGQPVSIAPLLLGKPLSACRRMLRYSIAAAVAPFQQFPAQHLRQGFMGGFERHFGARRSYGKGS